MSIWVKQILHYNNTDILSVIYLFKGSDKRSIGFYWN